MKKSKNKKYEKSRQAANPETSRKGQENARARQNKKEKMNFRPRLLFENKKERDQRIHLTLKKDSQKCWRQSSQFPYSCYPHPTIQFIKNDARRVMSIKEKEHKRLQW